MGIFFLFLKGIRNETSETTEKEKRIKRKKLNCARQTFIGNFLDIIIRYENDANLKVRRTVIAERKIQKENKKQKIIRE